MAITPVCLSVCATMKTRKLKHTKTVLLGDVTHHAWFKYWINIEQFGSTKCKGWSSPSLHLHSLPLWNSTLFNRFFLTLNDVTNSVGSWLHIWISPWSSHWHDCPQDSNLQLAADLLAISVTCYHTRTADVLQSRTCLHTKQQSNTFEDASATSCICSPNCKRKREGVMEGHWS